jgi:uncharacterized protein YkwD
MHRIALTLAAALAAALTAAPAAAAGPRLDGFERAVIAKLNDARAQHGLGPLRAHHGLNRAADTHSDDMLRADFFDHPSSDGTPFERRVRRFADVDLVGETLASLRDRNGGAATVVQMWLESPPHRAIVLRGDFHRIGVARRWGTLGGSRSAVVTADFASRR